MAVGTRFGRSVFGIALVGAVVAGADSPWAPRWMAPAVPAAGKYVVQITFADPGTTIGPR